MATVSILQPLATLGSEVQDADGNSVFILDATTNESHDNTTDITSHEVEEGIAITDHARVKPFELSIIGIVTNTPVDPQSAAVVESLIDGEVETVVQQTYEVMRDLMAARGLLTVITGLRTYQNMMLRSVRVVRSGPSKQDIRPQMDFVEVRIANTAFVLVPDDVLAARVKSSGSSKKDHEQQATKTASADEKKKYEKEKTNLASILDQFASLKVELE